MYPARRRTLRMRTHFGQLQMVTARWDSAPYRQAVWTTRSVCGLQMLKQKPWSGAGHPAPTMIGQSMAEQERRRKRQADLDSTRCTCHNARMTDAPFDLKA